MPRNDVGEGKNNWMDGLQHLLADLATGQADLSKRLHVEPGDEAAELVVMFNQHMENLQTEQIRQRIEHERYIAALEKALVQERTLKKLQRSFVNMASHEIRTPLSIIDGHAQGIERNISDITPANLLDRLKKIRLAVKRMTELIESTLDAAKMEAGTLRVDAEAIDIRAILLSCCEAQQELASSHEISVDHQDLPNEIVADPEALTQILTSLLSNAVKYSPEADRVDIICSQKDGDISIAVRDYGLGIDEEELDKLFTRYFRAKTSVGIPGTGIGLNLAQMLAHLQDGAITVTSTKGEGSIFTLRLPRIAGSIDQPAKAA